jgi:EF hand domain-containing protein
VNIIRRVVCHIVLCVAPIVFAQIFLAPVAFAQIPEPVDPLRNGPLIWDFNHDGIYTCDEWKRFADQLFTVADKNRNGFLEASEFPTIRKADPAFADADLGYFDDNGDGKVSRKEFVDKPSPFIARYDRNADCRVTPEELKGGGAQKENPAGKGRRGGSMSPKF